jgi:predicted transposase/invertase (TIGR01784 family)
VLAYHLRFLLLEQTHRFSMTDDLEFHVIELPKFAKVEHELGTELEKWLYILRHAEKMDTEAVPAAFQGSPMILRALEELKMLAQTDEERERYEARRKAQLDYNTGLKAARLEGREEGREEERIHTIHRLEKRLGRPATPPDALAHCSLEELDRIVDDLLDQLHPPR